jgi:hypothetical protein
MAPDIVEAQRHGVFDQRPQYPAAPGQLADRRVCRLVDPPCDEPREFAVRLVEHAQRGVARPRELLCGVEHSVEYHFDVELPEYAAGEVEHATRCFVHHRGGYTEFRDTRSALSAFPRAPGGFIR